MNKFQIIERPMSDAEFKQRCAWHSEYGIEHGNPPQTSEQYDIVAMEGDDYIGCASGVVYKNGPAYSGWMYLSNLYLEKPYRKRGLGAMLLCKLEQRVAVLGISKVWTHTGSNEAPGFYQKQGYRIIGQLEQRHSSKHHEVLLRKDLLNRREAKGGDKFGGNIHFIERPLTEAEQALTNKGFDEQTHEHGCPVQRSERHGFVAMEDDNFIGCISGLARIDGDKYNRWFGITDLFIDKPYRRRGIGTELLQKMEAKVSALGGRSLSTELASYEAVGFVDKHGFEKMYEFEEWYGGGESRLGMVKR